MSIQEMRVEIQRLTIQEQLRLLEMLTASLQARWTATRESVRSAAFDDAPLRNLIGVGRSSVDDIASRHDDYLYGPRKAY